MKWFDTESWLGMPRGVFVVLFGMALSLTYLAGRAWDWHSDLRAAAGRCP